MDVLLEEKKQQLHKLINELEDDNFLDQIIAMLELESLKVIRSDSKSISGEELKERLFKHIDSLPRKK